MAGFTLLDDPMAKVQKTQAPRRRVTRIRKVSRSKHVVPKKLPRLRLARKRAIIASIWTKNRSFSEPITPDNCLTGITLEEKCSKTGLGPVEVHFQRLRA